MTDFGYLLLSLLGGCAVLTYAVNRRHKNPLGCLVTGLIWTILCLSSAIGISTTLSMINSLSVYQTGVELEAEIISSSSYQSRDTKSGLTTTMYAPIVSFAFNGDTLEKELDISSSKAPVLGNMQLSPKRLWCTGFFVIEAMLTGGLVARRKALTKSTEYPVHPVGWISKGPPPLSKHL